MSDFIWGLTTRDIENAFWNGVSETAILVGGMAAAMAANAISRALLPNDRHDKPSGMKHLVCSVIGGGVGVLVAFRYADRLPHVTLAADKALKFFVISVVTAAIGSRVGWAGSIICFITSGGAFGYFGRNILRYQGAFGAVLGSALVTAVAAGYRARGSF